MRMASAGNCDPGSTTRTVSALFKTTIGGAIDETADREKIECDNLVALFRQPESVDVDEGAADCAVDASEAASRGPNPRECRIGAVDRDRSEETAEVAFLSVASADVARMAFAISAPD